MSKNRRTAAASAIFTDKGFYAILAASVIMVCLAAYLALSWENVNKDEIIGNEENRQSLSLDEVLEQGYIPDWPDDIKSSSVGTTETDITDSIQSDNKNDETQTAENEPEIPEIIELMQPVAEANVIAVNGFSGSAPVFSESMGDWRLHQGVDFITETSVEVLAAEEGIVEDVYDDGLMGMSVLLLHKDGTRTLYQSLDINPEVVKGMAVTKGYVIGRTGNTADSEALLGYHVHYAVIKDGAYVEPAK